MNATCQGNLSVHQKFATLPKIFMYKYAIFPDTITKKNTSYIHTNYRALKFTEQIHVRYSSEMSVYIKI